MADQAILREYLISLGFKVNSTEQKKFVDNLGGLDKGAKSAGKSVLGISAAVTTMATVFAYQMEKMYYASQRIGASVGSIQALKFGAQQIGISGEHMQGALEGIARSLRSNPGLLGLIQSFGIETKGRTMDKVAMDLVDTLNKMPTSIAERYGALFGIDADTLYMMRLGREEMKRAAEEQARIYQELGVDQDKAALSSKEMLNEWRGVMVYVDAFKGALFTAMLPGMRDMAAVTKEVLKDWIGIVQHSSASSVWKDLKAGLGFTGDRVQLSPEAQRQAYQTNPNYKLMPGQEDLPWAKRSTAPPPAAAAVASSPPPGKGSGDSSSLFAALEAKYNLPPGLLDKVWARESGRGKHMLSKAGAKGHMGFMDPTAKAYGVADPNDLGQAAEGSAHMWSDLLKQYHGDLRMAAAGYNWGSGRVAKYGLGAAPKETRDYMDAIAGGGIHQTVNINVSGAADAKATAEAIKEAQRQANSDLIRNFSKGAY